MTLKIGVFYFGVKHTEYNGIARAEVKLHSKAYAIQINPALEKVVFPNEAPRPIYLKSARPAGLDPSTQPPKEPGATAPPKSAAAPLAPAPPSSLVYPGGSETKEQPAIDKAPPEGITEEEFREALAYARRLSEEKKTPKAKAA